MRSSRVVLHLAAALGVGAVPLACGDTTAPSSRVDVPARVSAVAVRLDAVSVLWTPVTSTGVVAYRLERRANLGGPFTTIAPRIENNGSLDELSYLDIDVRPETYYGYRLRSINGAGEESAPSVVAGARTPPSPAIDVITVTDVASSAAADPNGYEVRIAGPASASSAIGATARHRFPLPIGTYTVSLEDLVSRCAVQGPASRSVVLSDTGTNTVVAVSFSVACADPNRGRIVATVATTGEDRDDKYGVELLGLAADNTLPESERVIARQQAVEGSNATTSFDNLRPGSYQLTLTGVERNCAVTGAPTRDVSVSAGSLDTVRYAVSCEGAAPPPPPANRPLVLRNAWSAASAAPNTKIVMRMTLDATARPDFRISSVQTEVGYDPAVVRIDSVKPVQGGMSQQDWGTVASSPGVILHIAQEVAGLGGTIAVSDFHFTIVGAAGTRAIARTTLTEVVDVNSRLLTDSAYVVDDTLQVAGGGTGTNQPPAARANGPYTGVAGSPVTFSAAGSSDPEGGPLTYGWSFGDGTTGTGASTSKTYASAGNYTVTLTVTDDKGATATSSASATITAGSPSNQPPTARINGPYTGTAGTAIAFSAAGSSDPEGGSLTYQWSFGDGTTATGVSPAKAYTAAGTFIVTLTVTDDKGATATAATTATITGGGGGGGTTPLTWSYSFGPVNAADSVVIMSVTYDLTTNLDETPGVEALQSWAVDSLKWNPAILKLYAFNFGPGGTGSVNSTYAGQGKLTFSGSIPQAQSTGLLTIATIRFKVIGASGQSTQTKTALGLLLGQPSTGPYVYNAKTGIIEKTFAVP